MARTARSLSLETRTARLKLISRKKPYFSRTGRAGVQLGYRRTKPRKGETNGTWTVRLYVGDKAYTDRRLGEADDYSVADGESVLTYHQAIAKLGVEFSNVQIKARNTVANAVNDYLLWSRTNRKSVKDTEWKLKAYLVNAQIQAQGPLFGDRLLASLTAHDADQWMSWAFEFRPTGRRKKPMKALVSKSANAIAERTRRRKSTLNRVIGIVKACFNREFEKSGLPSVEFIRRFKKYRAVDTARQHWLSLEEAKRLVNACDPDFRRIVQGALLTGARWSELRMLRVGDIDRQSATLLIAEAKSGMPRRIPLTDEGRAAFQSWTVGRGRDDAVFTDAVGNAWCEQSQKRPMKNACDGAKIVPAVGFHTLRHSYASTLVQAGVSLAIIAEALGHSDTRMVSKHYGHLAPSHVADAIRANLPSLDIQIDDKVRALRP